MERETEPEANGSERNSLNLFSSPFGQVYMKLVLSG